MIEASGLDRILQSVEHADLLVWLLDHDSRENLMLTLEEPVAIDGLPKVQGRELDHALQQAVHEGRVVGDLKPYSDIRLWTGLRLTAKALRDLGQWPPAGAEYREGPWDERRWGRVSRPLLAEFAERAPDDDVLLKPLGGDEPGEWQRWTDALRLREGGLVQARVVGMGMQDIRVTEQGRAALDPSVDDPLKRARVDLDRGREGGRRDVGDRRGAQAASPPPR